LVNKFSRFEQSQRNLHWLWSRAIHIADTNAPVDDADQRLVNTAAEHGADMFVTGD
jgi:predicted nucleic acid-binding protein